MISTRIASWLVPAPPPSRPAPRPWEIVLARAGWRCLLLAYAPIGVALAAFGLQNPRNIAGLIESAYDSSRPDLASAKLGLLHYVAWALPVAVLLVIRELVRERRGREARSVAWALLPAGATGLPALAAAMFEFRQPLLTGLIVVLLGVGAAACALRLVPACQPSRALARRWAWTALALASLAFVGGIGFLAHWRFITFNAAAYDLSWETNAVHNIVHSGVPKTSVGAGSYYPNELLPVSYTALHTPWIYYLFAPFYALFQDARTLLWSQTVLMSLGGLGVMLYARKVLRSELLAAALAIAYLLYPHVQVLCQHDLHANSLAIPLCLLALGAMQSGRRWLAFALVLLTCICREETAVYGIAVGLYWTGARGNAQRARVGWLATASSLAILLLITRVIIPGANGTPRYSHFGLFFDEPGIASIVKSLLFNPWGALSVFISGPRAEYLWLSLLPVGFVAILGFRGLIFALIPIGLLLPAGENAFFAIGVNYGAPIVVPVLVMAVLGARRLVTLLQKRGLETARARLACGVLVLTCAGAASVLYGNFLPKTYKLEFGAVPYRNSNAYDYRGYVGLVRKLPAYGERERLLWEVVEQVPYDGPISTSGRINPQLSNREVSLLYPELGQGHPAANRVKYVVLDRWPSLYESTEKAELELRQSKQYRVRFENPSGVIFERL